MPPNVSLPPFAQSGNAVQKITEISTIAYFFISSPKENAQAIFASDFSDDDISDGVFLSYLLVIKI